MENNYIEASKKFNELADELIKNNEYKELGVAFAHFTEVYGKTPLHTFEIEQGAIRPPFNRLPNEKTKMHGL